MNAEHCLVEREGHVLTITLNRPEAKNALSGGMLAGMYRAWRLLDEDSDLRVAILTGRGDVFCAGADLKAMGGGERDEEFQELMAEVPDLHWQALLRHNRPLKPIIAAVEGYAVAGGTKILQGTDIRVAAEDAVFGVTEARRGLFPLGGSSVRLRRQIPYTVAAEILLTGRHVSARRRWPSASWVGWFPGVRPSPKRRRLPRKSAKTVLSRSARWFECCAKSTRVTAKPTPW